MLPFAVTDCETDPFRAGQVPIDFVWGFFDGTRFAYFWKRKCAYHRYLHEYEYSVYAHNGGRFDFFYLLKCEECGESILDLKGKVKIVNDRLATLTAGKASVLDSWLLCPTGLAAYKKDTFNYDFLLPENREQRKSEILSYLEADCRYLWELLASFFETLGHRKRPLTLPSAAMSCLRDIQGLKVPESNDSFDARFRPFYFGGRCEVIRGGIHTGHFSCWDINSAYPKAMRDIDHPWGTGYVESSWIPDRPEILHRSFFVIDAVSDGCLPRRDPEADSLIYDRDGVERTYFATGHEIMAGEDTGTLRIRRCRASVTFIQGMRFDGFVDHFWAMKRDASDPAKRYTAKILLNGLYGKFAQDPSRFADWYFLDERPEDKPVKRLYQLGGNYIVGVDPIRRTYYNVATAASITGAVRAQLWRAICGSKDPLYCDTDSLFAADLCGNVGNHLGEWKHEGDFQRIAIAGRKLYAAFSSKGDCKLASKGCRLTPLDVVRIAEGDTVEWSAEVPTYSLSRGIHFQKRRIKRT